MCTLYMNTLQHDFKSQIGEGHREPLVEFIWNDPVVKRLDKFCLFCYFAEAKFSARSLALVSFSKIGYSRPDFRAINNSWPLGNFRVKRLLCRIHNHFSGLTPFITNDTYRCDGRHSLKKKN